MNEKPLELKSPDNAMALGLYFVIVIVAVALLIKPTITAIMVGFFGAAFLVPVWALFMLLASGTGLISAFLAPKLQRPVLALRAECGAVLCVGLATGCYVAALLGAPHSLMTLLVWGGISAVCLWRSLQVFRELRLLRVAQRKRVTATLESLADPRPEK